MITTIENDIWRAEIDSLGAQLKSLCHKGLCREYLWQGCAEIWSGTCPVLFPITGGLWNKQLRWQGREYTLPRHGFAKNLEWTLLPQAEADRAVFRIQPGVGYPATAFPFPLALELTFCLQPDGLAVYYRVWSTQPDREGYYQIGGHPAFMLSGRAADVPTVTDEREGYLRLLDKQGQPCRRVELRIAGEQGCLEERTPVLALDDEGLLAVTPAAFADDTIIVAGRQVGRVELLDNNYRRVLTVESPAPAWLFWRAAAGRSPFVCIEPWWGLPDTQHFCGEFSEKYYVQHLLPGGVDSGLLWQVHFPL
ncbi:MAG: hypothetical protein ACI353_01140 [Alloprevotella sp.]